MRAENRKRLMCRKHIIGGIWDAFTVTVREADADNAKREFERQGYTVSVM